jgi:hypothetical protein
LRWFVRGGPSLDIARETRLDRKRVLRALTIVRVAIRRSFPADVRRALNYEPVAASRRMRLPRHRQQKPKRGPATLGLAVGHGREWVEVVPATAVEELSRALRGGRLVGQSLSRQFERYAAVVYRGRLYRLRESPAGATMPFGRIEAFWAYLQRQLRAKGGIRRERLALYLAEYVWRYHHRHVPPADQARKLVTLIRQYQRKGQE